MKIVEINTVHYGSTGKIMLQIAECARERGHIVNTFSKKWKENPTVNEFHTYLGTRIENVCHRILGPIFAREGCFSFFSTYRLVRRLRTISPDVIHLHNLHGWYLNLPMLFRYIKKYDVRVIWTLHDCWSFTGQCPYFSLEGCAKWKSGCHHCTQYRKYPQAYMDRTKSMWKLKKGWFTGVKDMTIVPPSCWLAELVKQSFLKDYPVKVINNGIDLSVFKPTESDFRKKYNCENKHILLGVALGWSNRKGLHVFAELAKRLPGDYQIVLVGTSESSDEQLPENIISIHRTHNQQELAKIYTAADLFVNPTYEDNFPTVNIESLACGTPVLTFRTGGSPEIIDVSCGSVVPCDDVDALEKEIVRICSERPYTSEACVARAKKFDMNDRFKEYVNLYERKTN